MNTQVPVNKRALFSRINRKMNKDGEKLHRCRSDSRWYNDMGPFYTVDINTNTVIARGVSDLESLGRELGVLKPFEKLESENIF